MPRHLDELKTALSKRILEYQELEEIYGADDGEPQKNRVRGAILYLRDEMLKTVSDASDLPDIPERMLPQN